MFISPSVQLISRFLSLGLFTNSVIRAERAFSYNRSIVYIMSIVAVLIKKRILSQMIESCALISYTMECDGCDSLRQSMR